MACIYLLNSRGGPQSFDFDITYLYPIIVTPYVLATFKVYPWYVSLFVKSSILSGMNCTISGNTINTKNLGWYQTWKMSRAAQACLFKIFRACVN